MLTHKSLTNRPETTAHLYLHYHIWVLWMRKKWSWVQNLQSKAAPETLQLPWRMHPWANTGANKRPRQLTQPIDTTHGDCHDRTNGGWPCVFALLSSAKPLPRFQTCWTCEYRSVLGGEFEETWFIWAISISIPHIHNTETLLLRVHSDILTPMDKRNITMLVSFHLLAAFDIIDHQILLQRLER